ncbi:ABC-type amino acid transport system, permease component [Candidatus Liberibacter americanus str. Sao Paulo]|uniref:ABC-type amino acid transport system, permease component n=2 Tax=Candidatus Liberibacter americanus TaxID=309868 RepID=U6B5K7_9HYPH|nr:ABC-type amino acid transport system, permease component [Candidatus Liberibacter americanus str. Sao Paulo]
MFTQALILSLIVIVLSKIISNISYNMDKSNISLGLDFLQYRAGFEIDQGIIPYNGDDSYARALLVGFTNTFTLALLGVIPSTIIGIFIGIGRLSSNKLLSWICRIYVEIFRNIPPLVVIFFWYRSLLSALPSPEHSVYFPLGIFLSNRGIYFPKLIMDINAQIILFVFLLGIVLSIVTIILSRKFHERTGRALPVYYISIFLTFGLPVILLYITNLKLSFDYPVLGNFNFDGGFAVCPEFISLYIALSCYTASFIAEIIRLGITSVPRGQMEAATALGLNRGKATRFIILPQAMRVIIPPLTSQYLNLLKNSSLAVTVGFSDLVSVGGVIINQTGQAIEIVLIWMFIYLSLSIMTSLLMNWINKKIALREVK